MGEKWAHKCRRGIQLQIPDEGNLNPLGGGVELALGVLESVLEQQLHGWRGGPAPESADQRESSTRGPTRLGIELADRPGQAEVATG